MENRYMLKRWEISCLLINLIIYKLFTVDIKCFLRAENSSFLSALLTVICFLVITFFISEFIETKAYKKVYYLINKNIFSRFIFGIILILYFIFSFNESLRQVVQFFNIVAFPSAPFIFVASFFLVPAIISASRGKDGAVKPNSLIAGMSIFLIFITALAAQKFVDVTNLFPAFGEGLYKTFILSLKNITFFSDFFVVLFILKKLDNENVNYKKTIRFSALVASFVLLWTVLFVNLLIPSPVILEIQFPLYQIMKNVYFGRFFQRIDAFYIVTMSLSLMAFFSFVILIMTFLLKKIFNLQKGNVLAVSAGLILILLGMNDNINYVKTFWFFVVIFSSLLILLYSIKNIRRRR